MDQANKTLIKAFLDSASEAYYHGKPIISDSQFDNLAELIGYSTVGTKSLYGKTGLHYKTLYSLNKYYPGEGKCPLMDYTGPKSDTPKLDGAAISLLYVKGMLVQALTRGDGVEGEVITDKVLSGSINWIPLVLENDIDLPNKLQISGEVVALNTVSNARNYVSGALNLKDLEEFKTRELYFVAYDSFPEAFNYNVTLSNLAQLGFCTVNASEWEQFPQDGRVIRVIDSHTFNEMGFTSKAPRGAYALKIRKEGKVTTLRDVVWQTGKSGKITPVAIFDPVELGGAKVTKATLNNPAYIQSLDLHIGDLVEIQRSGEIIPQVVRKVSQE